MSRQLRFDTPTELATKMIAKLSQDELNVTTRALIVHINAQIPVKQIEQAVAASTDKIWLYQAKNGWMLANIGAIMLKVSAIKS